MKWTKTAATMGILAFVFAATPCGAAEPEDAGLSAAESAVRNARDAAQDREKIKETKPVRPECAASKEDCSPKTEDARRPQVGGPK